MRYKPVIKPQPEWTPWFAWLPVPLGGYPITESTTMVWWEWIERKNLGSDRGDCNAYNYRLPEPKPTRPSQMYFGDKDVFRR